MRVKFVAVVAIVGLQFGCVTTTPETVKTMSSEFLCEMLGPAWISTKREQEIMREELRTRNLACDYGRLRTMSEPSHVIGFQSQQMKRLHIPATLRLSNTSSS